MRGMPVYSQLSLVLINRPRRDGTLGWRWYTAAADEITRPALDNMATGAHVDDAYS